jgi:hypothetical protein
MSSIVALFGHGIAGRFASRDDGHRALERLDGLLNSTKSKFLEATDPHCLVLNQFFFYFLILHDAGTEQ